VKPNSEPNNRRDADMQLDIKVFKDAVNFFISRSGLRSDGAISQYSSL
jgi:hypothetical protein